MSTFKNKIIKLHNFISTQIGVDLQKLFRSIRTFGRYARDWRQFRRNFSGTMTINPCLQDRFEEGGVTKNEYFWQDLTVARWIYEAKPLKHVDVGSRVDGFVAHVASFRDVEVFDVRPITSHIPGVIFKQADFMQTASLADFILDIGYCDSVSCLHAIEHFGLGRYGDSLDPRGYEKGITNLAMLLKPGGKLYLSTPIGIERVEFNANWIFNPDSIIESAKHNGLDVVSLFTINSERTGLQQIIISESTLSDLAQRHYNLGLFVFIKR